MSLVIEFPRKSRLHRQILLETLEAVSFRAATPEDIPRLVELGGMFFEESGMALHGAFFSAESAESWLETTFQYGTYPHIVAEVDGVIVGGISFNYDEAYTVKPVAILDRIYVIKEHRRSAIGRLLLQLAMEEAFAGGATTFIASGISEMPETMSLQNMFHKASFTIVGFTAIRRI